jgi:hypothetical protein
LPQAVIVRRQQIKFTSKPGIVGSIGVMMVMVLLKHEKGRRLPAGENT